MGYIPLDNIVRSAIADKGHSTLHLYIPFLHWAFEALGVYETEGVFPNLKSTRGFLDANKQLPFPEDMKMWNRVGFIRNGHINDFRHNNSLSLDAKDFTAENTPVTSPTLFAYDGLDSFLYTTNVYVATEDGIVVVSGDLSNSFRVNWGAKKFQFARSMANTPVYIEYVAESFNPTSVTLVNAVAKRFFTEYIFWREARFNHGAAHRETVAREAQFLEAEDDLRAEFSDLTGDGITFAMNQAMYTR